MLNKSADYAFRLNGADYVRIEDAYLGIEETAISIILKYDFVAEENYKVYGKFVFSSGEY